MIAGRYSLEREIGRGGMGAVWLGRDDVLGRQVAMKRIGMLPGADSTDVARAEREARLSAQLHHPHVVAVFDIAADDDADTRWLVMEYVEGRALSQLIRDEGPQDPDEAARLVGQVADALLAAHEAGIVHRDVKPSNILITRDREAKLADFGIARISSDPSLTQTGMVTGSPAYLSPEVAAGGRGDAAGDVWSLGATMFHVLAGRPPYEVGDHVLGALYRVVNEEPPRLDNAGWLAPMLEGTMTTDPANRWSMPQVRAFLAGAPEPTIVVPPRPDAVATGPAPESEPGTQVWATPSSPRSTRASERRRDSKRPLLIGAGLVGVMLLALLLFVVLGDDGGETTADPPRTTPSASPTKTAPPAPSAEAMKAFIGDYVTAVGEDPEVSWQMLTPKFQTESGGFEKYRSFWDPATNGRLVSIDANPDDLSVSYQVRYDNWDNGPGPTVLDLTFDDGRYFIDGERSEGFTPAG